MPLNISGGKCLKLRSPAWRSGLFSSTDILRTLLGDDHNCFILRLILSLLAQLGVQPNVLALLAAQVGNRMPESPSFALM